jgi:hypothetical protein
VDEIPFPAAADGGHDHEADDDGQAKDKGIETHLKELL